MGRSLFLDVKDGELTAYLFEVKGGKSEVAWKENYPLSGKHDFRLDNIPSDIENAYLSLPLAFLNCRVIELPFSGKDRIREVLPFELDGMILGGPDNVVFDNVVIDTLDDKYRVLAVYVEKTVLRSILEKLRSLGIDPVFVTSIELRPALKDFEFTKLLAPASLAEKDRTGLALEEMKTPTIDLRRGEFAYTRETEKTRKSLRVTTVLLILTALIWAGYLAFQVVSTRSEIASVRNEMRKQYQEIFPGEKNIVNEFYQLKSHMKELKGKEDVFVGVNALDLLLKLSQIDRQGSMINEVVVDRTNITLRGDAPSLSDIQQFQGRLKNAFEEVNITDSRSSAQGRMLFTITVREKKT